MPKAPLVSVIITCYNQQDTIIKALESVYHQTYNNIEVIVVDDCSEDSSMELLEAHKYKCATQVLSTKVNSGVSKSRNLGIARSVGDLITYLDGDDYFNKTKIFEEVKTLIETHSDVVFSNFVIQRSDGPDVLWNHELTHMQIKPLDILTRNFPHCTVYRNELIKSDILKTVNYYDKDLKIYEDWDLRIRYSFISKISYCNNIGMTYCSNQFGLSKQHSMLFHSRIKLTIIKKNKRLIQGNFATKSAYNNLISTYSRAVWYSTSEWSVRLYYLFTYFDSFMRLVKVRLFSPNF